MNLALILLKTGQTLITLTEQLEYEPKVHMVNPMSISGKTKLSLTRWPEYTDDEHVLLNTDTLLTLCEPTEAVRKAYLKKIGLTEEDLKPPEQPDILDEDETVPDGEDYEPAYAEESLY